MNSLITYNNVSLSKQEFEKKVYKTIENFKGFEELDDFVLINTDNPIEFYILLFALWRSNKKVVFPNRDFFEGADFKFVKYYINVNEIYENKNFLKIDIDNNIDTVLFSSGSTGMPKGICHNSDTFFQNTNDVIKLMNINQNIVSGRL